MVKEEKRCAKEQHSLIIMDTFEGQDKQIKIPMFWKKLWNCLHNLTNKFYLLDISINKVAKASIQNRYNECFSYEVAIQLMRCSDPADVMISSKLSDMKPLHVSWIVDFYNHMF